MLTDLRTQIISGDNNIVSNVHCVTVYESLVRVVFFNVNNNEYFSFHQTIKVEILSSSEVLNIVSSCLIRIIILFESGGVGGGLWRGEICVTRVRGNYERGK